MYKRTALAQQIADRMLSTSQTGAASAGLFLSAPRRTGKSTFLREDLLPELVSRQAEVIYVDLWSDPSADPGDLIVSAVRAALAKYDKTAAQLA
jgi:predicted AAA+ superfamily ATPase